MGDKLDRLIRHAQLRQQPQGLFDIDASGWMIRAVGPSFERLALTIDADGDPCVAPGSA